MKIVSVGNRICGTNGCNKEVKIKVQFGLGFSAGFCEDCADSLKRQGLSTKVTEIIKEPNNDTHDDNDSYNQNQHHKAMLYK